LARATTGETLVFGHVGCADCCYAETLPVSEQKIESPCQGVGPPADRLRDGPIGDPHGLFASHPWCA
jgi:hypothetical protein